MTARYRCETCGVYEMDQNAKAVHLLGNPRHEVVDVS